MANAAIVVERSGEGFATLLLNRPDKLNTLSIAMRREMAVAITALEADPAVRVLILSGVGRAFTAGLVDQVVADDLLQAAALALAQRLAAGPTLAYGEIKRLFLRAGAAQMQALFEDEALTLARVAASADAQEGISAMVERRKPVFRGC